MVNPEALHANNITDWADCIYVCRNIYAYLKESMEGFISEIGERRYNYIINIL